MLHLIPLETQGPRGWARALLTLGVGTLTAAWLSVWAALLAASLKTPPLLPGPAQEAIVLCGAAVARWLLRGQLGERAVRALFIVTALLAAAIAAAARFPRGWLPLDLRWHAHLTPAPIVATALIALALWGAGGHIGASPLDDYAVFRFFATGIAGLFGGLILNAPAGADGVPAPVLGAAAAVFFAAAFLTLPAAQLVSVRERGRARGSRLPPLDRRWAGIAGAAALGILALALILSAASSGALLTTAADLLGRLPDLLFTILSPFIIAAGYLAQGLIDLIRRLLGTPHYTAHPSPQPARPTRPPHSQHQGHPPLVGQILVDGVIVVVLAVIIVALLSRAVGRRSALQHEQAFEEARDSVWSWEEAGAGWRAALGKLRGRLRHAQRRGHAGAAGPPRSIREAYRRLLRHGAALGHARAAPETPQEYLARLRGIPIPDERDASALTAAYMRVRYGDEPEHPEDVEQAARSWERLDQALRH